MIDRELYHVYLTPDQLKCVAGHPNIRVFRPRRLVNSVSADAELIVRAAPNWTHPAIVKSLRPGVFLVEGGTDVRLLMEDAEVLSVREYPRFRTMNRYTSGFLRGGAETNELSSDPRLNWCPARYGSRFTGAGQTVTVVDTGVDVRHPFFYDSSVVLPLPVNASIPRHRKFVRYDAFMDGGDAVNGHGTHVAGTIAGRIEGGGQVPKIARFEGVAPGAKLHVVDVGRPGERYLSIPPVGSMVRWMGGVNATISSNSWGSSAQEQEEDREYDEAAYENPEILWVFAAGNGEYQVTSPAGSKNVLTVAASTNPIAHMASMAAIPGRAARPVIMRVQNGTDVWDVACAEWNEHDAGVVQADVREDLSLSQWANLEIAEANGTGRWAKRLIQDWAPTEEQVAAAADEGAVALLVGNETVLDLPEVNSTYVIPVLTCDANGEFASAARASFLPGAPQQADTGFTMAYFSSEGPTMYGTDGADIAAPGVHYIFSAKGENASEPVVWNETRQTFTGALAWKGGTSMATPAISGLVALFRQALGEEGFLRPSSFGLRAALVASARPLLGVEGLNTRTGFGHPSLRRWVETPHTLLDWQEIEGGEQKALNITLTNATDLRVVMCFLDPPLSGPAVWPFFADVNLHVRNAEDGVWLRGNGRIDQFATIELVALAHAAPGVYEVRVTCSELPQEAETVRFALAVSGVAIEEELTDYEGCIPGCAGRCESGVCVCGAGKAGPLCDQPVQEVQRLSPWNVSMRVKELAFFHYVRSTSEPYLSFDARRMDGANLSGGGVQVCISGDPVRDMTSAMACTSSFERLGAPSEEGVNRLLFVVDETDPRRDVYGVTYCAASQGCSYLLRVDERPDRDPWPTVCPAPYVEVGILPGGSGIDFMVGGERTAWEGNGQWRAFLRVDGVVTGIRMLGRGSHRGVSVETEVRHFDCQRAAATWTLWNAGNVSRLVDFGFGADLGGGAVAEQVPYEAMSDGTGVVLTAASGVKLYLHSARDAFSTRWVGSGGALLGNVFTDGGASKGKADAVAFSWQGMTLEPGAAAELAVLWRCGKKRANWLLIAGIIIIVVIGAAWGLAMVVWYVRRKRKKNDAMYSQV